MLFGDTCGIMWQELPDSIILLFPKMAGKVHVRWDRLKSSRSFNVAAFQAAFVNMLAYGQQFFRWWATTGYSDNVQIMLAHQAYEIWAEKDPDCPYNLDSNYDPAREVIRMLGWQYSKANPLRNIQRWTSWSEQLPAVQKV
jgi:hypothetical protein